jgi:hypothetical protein
MHGQLVKYCALRTVVVEGSACTGWYAIHSAYASPLIQPLLQRRYGRTKIKKAQGSLRHAPRGG